VKEESEMKRIPTILPQQVPTCNTSVLLTYAGKNDETFEEYINKLTKEDFERAKEEKEEK